jgi:metallophosphoesterase superfamily enzyme
LANTGTAHYQIMGHFHPKLSHVIKRQHMTGKCFISSKHELIMPSLGVYTGGLFIDDPVYQEVLSSPAQQAVLCYQQKAFLLPLNK